MSTTQTTQERFNERYITSSEIQERLKVDRSAILSARRRGMLPQAIMVPGVRAYIWERGLVTPYLEAWKISLASHRGELA